MLWIGNIIDHTNTLAWNASASAQLSQLIIYSFSAINTIAFYCPANLNGNSFPDTSSVQLDISTLHAYDTPTDNCISDIRFVEFCYRRGSFKNLAFTFVIMNGFRGNRRVVQKVPVMAIPSADRCGHDIEYWKCCAERAIGPIWIDSTATYGVAVAPTANTLLSFAGTYVPQSLAGLSIESAVSTINQRPPTYIRQAVVRFHVSLINTIFASGRVATLCGMILLSV